MMKKVFLYLMVMAATVSLNAQIEYSKYFTDKVLRFDFVFAGNSGGTVVYPVDMREEPYFGGSRTQLVDPFNYGSFKYEVYDAEDGTLIYSRGYCTLYQEWQTTAEAKKISRVFHEVATMPFPKKKIRFVMNERQRNGLFKNIYETEIDPADYFIVRESSVKADVTKVLDSGDPAEKVDVVYLAEGYTAEQMDKFRHDVNKMMDIFFSVEPYKSRKNKFNIWAVESVSIEEGTDLPGKNIYSNTVFNSTFYTFDIDRYLTSFDIKSINDYAALAPHDIIVILVNTDVYGGGGFYNYYNITAVDNKYSNRVFIHEFGHGFAGLADEYYSSEVAYEDYYPLDVEPWEPNITTLVDFESKWKDKLDKNTPVPTPAIPKYDNIVGVFEGGGYSAKGIYRPEQNCTMKSNTDKGFCPVCMDAIIEMINFYCK